MLLEVSHLKAGYGEAVVVEDVSIKVEQGTTVALLITQHSDSQKSVHGYFNGSGRPASVSAHECARQSHDGCVFRY